MDTMQEEDTVMYKPTQIAAGLLAGSLLSTGASAATTAELEQRIQELEQTVRLLSRKQEVSEEVYVADKTRAATNGTVKAGPDGFALVSPDKKAELKFRGLMQFDGRFGVDDDKDNDTFLFRRLRPTIDGRIGDVSWRITPEFANDDADLVDGYIDYKTPWPVVARAGQYKAPVGLERLQSGSAIVFLERAFPTELAPNRDRGFAAYSTLLDNRLSLELSGSNGTADGRDATNVDFDGEPEVAARIFFEPVPGIGFGIAGTHGEKISENDTRTASTSNANAFLPRYRSPAQNTIFQYNTGAIADGDHTRFTPQAYAYVGPFGVMVEYIESKQAVGYSTEDENFGTDDFTNKAAQITGVWSITGEDQSFKGIKPSNPGLNAGAWELALRYSTLEIDDDVFDLGFSDPNKNVQKADEAAIGVNWVITQNVKLMANYTHTSFDGGAAKGGDREDEEVISTRVQLNY
jgi:phosphate-selective porin OprO/OprP